MLVRSAPRSLLRMAPRQNARVEASMSLHLSSRGERVAAGGLGLLRAKYDTNTTCALAALQLRVEDMGLAHPLLSVTVWTPRVRLGPEITCVRPDVPGHR